MQDEHYPHRSTQHLYEKIDGFSSDEEQGQLLEKILTLVDPQDRLVIAEIGVYKGRGTAIWNEHLMSKGLNYKYYAIDHFLGSAEHDKNINYYDVAFNNLKPISDKIYLIKNDSISESQKHADGYFDIVYIDASHEYEHVKKDIQSWLPKVRPGGIMCGDDYIAGWPGVVKAVDEIFPDKVNIVGRQQWWVKKI